MKRAKANGSPVLLAAHRLHGVKAAMGATPRLRRGLQLRREHGSAGDLREHELRPIAGHPGGFFPGWSSRREGETVTRSGRSGL
jgi:hypothetical protein